MKELNEEELQQWLEQELKAHKKPVFSGENKDAALYRLLFTELANEPRALQNGDLAEVVVKQIKINEQKAETLRYNLIIAAVVAAGILLSYFAINYISPADLKSALQFIALYKWIIIFIILCFSAIEIADKNLVKRKLV